MSRTSENRRLLAALQDVTATFRQTHGRRQWHSSRRRIYARHSREYGEECAHNNSLAVVQTGPLRRSAAVALALVDVLVFYCIGNRRPAPSWPAMYLLSLWWWRARLCPFVLGMLGLFAGRYCRTMGYRALLSNPRPARHKAPGSLHRGSLPPRKADAALHRTLSRQCA